MSVEYVPLRPVHSSPCVACFKPYGLNYFRVPMHAGLHLCNDCAKGLVKIQRDWLTQQRALNRTRLEGSNDLT